MANRESKRDIERMRRRAETQGEAIDPERVHGEKERTGVRQFLREVRAEMKKVAWPGRREVTSYSLVVLVAVSLVTIYVYGLDQAFGSVVFRIFN